METRANHVFVGAVTLALLVTVVAVIIWIARLHEGKQQEYDIFFQQSVDGLAKGTEVAYNGVPAGKIEKIELWKKDPSFIRVRISINQNVPILVGTTATIQSSFTGVADIQLSGGIKGNPPITEPGPEGVPVIPAKRSGFGEILANAPLLLDRLATLTERLNELLSEKNQKSITGILANTNRMTAELAKASPQMKKVVSDLDATIVQAQATLAQFEQVAGKANVLLGDKGDTLANDLRASLRSAKAATDELKETLSDARPALREMSNSTLPAADAALRDLRATSRALRQVTEKIDEQGASALVGGEKLPDYKP